MNKKKDETKKNNQVESGVAYLKELWKNPKGRALLFFGFYFIFFLVLGISFRASASAPQKNLTLPSQLQENANYSIQDLVNGNYQFTYQENVNGVSKELTGKAYNQMKQVTNNYGNMYFLYSGIVIQRLNDVWQICDNPFYYRQILEEGMLKKTLDAATFESKTLYQNKQTVYRYQISTTTLWDLYQNEKIDIADEPNIIEVYVTENGQVEKIFYNYSSDDTYLRKTPMQTYFTVSYQDYGKIEAFEVPS